MLNRNVTPSQDPARWGAQTLRLSALALGLAFGLSACDIFGGSSPGVVRVTPENGATNVEMSSSVVAILNLPGSESVNLTTLDENSVVLTSGSGEPVPSRRILSDDGKTLTVTPTASLMPNTSYTFAVTDALETAEGTRLGGWESSFRTGNGTGIDADLLPDRVPVVFNAGGDIRRDVRSLTLTNIGDKTIDVSSLSLSGDAASQFSLTDDSPFSLAVGETKELELTFQPRSLGPQLANLTIESNADRGSTLNIPLGGLGVAGQGGNKEPSLQWIFDTYGLPIASGDTEPESTGIAESVSGDGTLLGDEVTGQSFVKASATEPVTIEALATFGVENTPVTEFGYYKTGSPSERSPLFAIQDEPTLNEQRLDPEIDGSTDANGRIVFDPGSEAFGLYSYWPSNRFFTRRYVFTEDRFNSFTAAIPHHVRTYPYKNSAGEVVPNAYVVATEEFTQGFDYNDIVVIIRNVTPQPAPEPGGDPRPPTTPPTPSLSGIGGLSVSNTLNLPSSNRMILHHITKTFGRFCNPEDNPDCDPTIDAWQNIYVRDTGTVRLQNTGGSTLSLELSFYYPDQFFFPKGESSLTLQPGASYDLDIAFSPVGRTRKTVLSDALVIRSGSATAGMALTGIYMSKPEGANEIYLQPLVNSGFSYDVDFGSSTRAGIPSSDPASALVGEEVRSAYWTAANPSSPILVTQIAALHSCCRSGDAFGLYTQGSSEIPFAAMRTMGSDGNTIYPRQSRDTLAQLSTSTNAPFEIRVANYSSDPNLGAGNGNLGVRTWPLRDENGTLVPNTYLIAQDYVEAGCGSSDKANCDYNDNLYIIENIAPAN